MTKSQAIRLAIAALKKERRLLAVDANFHDKYKANTPHAVLSSQKRVMVNEAIAVLEAELCDCKK